MPIESPVGWSTILQALAHDDRLELFRYLNRVTEARIEEVGLNLLDRPDEASAEELTQIEIMLHHVHIPILTEAGLLSHDHRDDRVELTALGAQLPAEVISPTTVELPDTEDKESATE
jgi:imidazole glycerol phosphate synthase subunit HisF